MLAVAEFPLHFANSDKWWNENIDAKALLANRKIPIDCTLTIPTESLPPMRYQTRVQTPHIPQDKARSSVTYYELEYLGRGSFGRVSRILDLQWGGIMAVKIIDIPQAKEKETKETLKREVELLAKLSHPHIIDYKHSQGWEWRMPIEIFMSAADGSLRGFLDDTKSKHKKMAKIQIDLVSKHILSALHYLYGKKIIHRDIKPENILFKDIFINPIFSLADFGFSKEIDCNTTFVGTPIYWAPEICLSAQQDFRVDIWSFGVVIYEMLTGLALDQVPGLTNHICASGEWCRWLEDACGKGYGLARMVTFNVDTQITIEECCASPNFPILPDTLPQPSRRAYTQASTTLIPRTQLERPSNRQNKMNGLGVASPRRIDKARHLRQTPVPRR